MKIRIGKSTDYFLSSYTVNGRRSFFAQTVGQCKRVIGLSGASAQIRSRIARQIGILLLDRGYNVELIHGINNPNDLEGIVVPELELIIADAKRLRECEGKEDTDWQMIDLNQFIYAEQYAVFEAKIKDLQEQIAVDLDLVHEYLNQAQNRLICHEGGQSFSEQQHYNLLSRLAKSLFFTNYGKLEHRFAQSLTGEGRIDYYQGLLKNIRRRYYLNDVSCRSATRLLGDLAKEALKAGLDCEIYHDFLDEEQVELVIIPHKEIAIAARAIDASFQELLTYKDKAASLAVEERIEPDIDDKLGQITDILEEVKNLSSTVGELYQGMMDFEAIEALEETLLAKILAG